MKTVIHRASSRGHADHGWLDTHHTFSFAHYFDPGRMGFGKLRVLNDDVVQGGKGFGTHPHENMEIVSIPIWGALEHKDSTGNTRVIHENDVQIMSAGSGVTHSEYNHSPDKPVNFLQIWIMPRERNIQPRYDQKTFPTEKGKNLLRTVVSPGDDEDTLRLNQDAWLSLGDFDAGMETTYVLHKKDHGIYVFVIEGRIRIGGEELSRRDGAGIREISEAEIEIMDAARFLIIEIPMN